MCASRRNRCRNREALPRRGNHILAEVDPPEHPTMSLHPLPQPSRRDVLRLAGGTAAYLAVAASPSAALAQIAPGGAPLKIATIGAGKEGGALGTLFAKAGHPVMFSSRHPEQLNDLVASAGPLTKAGTVEE